MNLYEITNGYTGESYVRVYAWASSEKRALELAKESFGIANRLKTKDLEIKLLFSASYPEFCTRPSDDGFAF